MRSYLRHYRNRVAVLTVLFLNALIADRSLLANELLDRILKEGADKWSQYKTAAKELQGSYRATFRETKPSSGLVQHENYVFKHNNRCALIIADLASQGTESNKRITLHAINSKYAFELYKPSEAATWLLADLNRGITADEGKGSELTKGAVKRLVMTPLLVVDHLVEDVLKAAEMKTKDVSAITINGKHAVKITFENTSQGEDKEKAVLRGGWIILQPDQWLVSEYSVVSRQWFGSGGRLVKEFHRTVKNHYLASATVASFPKKVTREIRDLQDGRTVQHTFDFDVYLEPLSDEEFKLSAFGLSEPPPLPGRGPGLFVWLAGAGIICMAVGAWLTWRWKKTL